MLVNLNHLFKQHNNYAIAGFNVYGYEDAVSVIKAAENLKEPVILMVNRDAENHIPLDIIGPMLISLAKKASVAVSVHLDHSICMKSIELAIQVGFSSVMFDGSQLSKEENIGLTRKVIALAHPHDVSVEAEIGSVGYSDPAVKAKWIYTEPEEALEFYQATGVDCLAVAVGTVHRMTAQTANIQFDSLKRIHEMVKVPLVIHGSTGVPDEDLKKLSASGVSKINIGTSLRMAFGKTLRQAMEDQPDEFDRIKLFQLPMQEVQRAAEQKMQAIRP